MAMSSHTTTAVSERKAGATSAAVRRALAGENRAPPGDAKAYRRIAIGLLALAVLAPICLIVYQSFLDNPFFAPTAQLSLSAYASIL